MKKKLELEESEARGIYKTASPEFKKVLENTFGKEFFKMSVENRVFSIEDAITETGRPSVPDFDCIPTDLRDFFKSVYKCIVITEAFNEGERIDIYNSDKRRHYPYFLNNGSASAFGLRATYYVSTLSDAGSGSRLSLLKSDNAKVVGERFKNEFRDMLSL